MDPSLESHAEKKCFPSSNNHRSDGLIVLLSLIIIIRIIYICIHI